MGLLRVALALQMVKNAYIVTTHTRIILTATLPGEPALASCPLTHRLHLFLTVHPLVHK